MQREIDDRLAKALLAGDIRDGDTVLVALASDGDGLVVTRMKPDGPEV
jgi:ATP-dependent Clp protease ATP-binding subunit ClpB